MAKQTLDILTNRKAEKYTKAELARRVLWAFCAPLFRFSPRIFFGWRRFILRMFGAKIGIKVNIYRSATIYMPWNIEIGDWSAVGEHAYIYNLGKVTIGEKSTISHRVHICAGTHDYTKSDLPLLKPPVIIGDQVWICTDAFVGPGVKIGNGAVVGARAVVTKDIEPWTVVAGNPAKFIKQRIMNSERPSS